MKRSALAITLSETCSLFRAPPTGALPKTATVARLPRSFRRFLGAGLDACSANVVWSISQLVESRDIAV